MEERRRSHGAAAIRPARLDELLELQSELRRRQVCLRGLPDSPSEPAEELARTVALVLETLVGPAVPVADCWRVGRFAPGRPRPVILRFEGLGENIAVLRCKGQLYGNDVGDCLRGLRLYHDLSPLQLSWKRGLRDRFDGFLKDHVRVVWRRGYRLFALLKGSWVEFFPPSALV